MDYAKEIISLRTQFEEFEKRLYAVKKIASIDYQTQIDTLLTNVTACQNGLTSIEQDLLTINETLSSHDTSISAVETTLSEHATQITNLETSVAQMQSDNNTLFTGIQANIESLQASVTTINGQITSITTSISDINSNITTISSDLSNINSELDSLNTTITSACSNISTLQTQMSSVQSDIASVQTSLTTAQTNISTNASNISSLQSSLSAVAFSGDYDDLTNKPTGGGTTGSAEESYMPDTIYNIRDEYYQVCDFSTTDDITQSRKIKSFFVCSPESAIEGTCEVRIFPAYFLTHDYEVRVYCNEELIASKVLTLDGTAEIVTELSFKFYPKQKKNYFYATVYYGSIDYFCYHYYSYFKINSSKNFMFLNRDFRQTVFVYKNKYYFTKNQTRSLNYYKVTDATNFDLTNDWTVMTQFSYDTYLYPKITYTTTTFTIDDTIPYYLTRVCTTLGFMLINTVVFGVANRVIIEINGYGISYFREPLHTRAGPTVTGIFTADRILGYWSGHKYQTGYVHYDPYTLNGVDVESGCWVENMPIHQLDMDNAPFGVFQGSVAVRDDAMCIFFPHYNSTYTIELGYGRRPTCFRQENGDIHIYLGRVNHVLKIVLIKNATTNQYEISSQEKIFGYEEYYETLDNKAIVKFDGAFSLIDA